MYRYDEWTTRRPVEFDIKVKNWQVSLLFAYWKIKFPNLLNYKIRVSFDFTFIFFIEKKLNALM